MKGRYLTYYHEVAPAPLTSRIARLRVLVVEVEYSDFFTRYLFKYHNKYYYDRTLTLARGFVSFPDGN